MSKKMMYIIAGVIIVILVAGGALVFGKKENKTDNSANTTKTEANDVDSSDDASEEDLGLCDIVDKATIKSALGSNADNLDGPNNTGVTSLGDGDKGQTCVYPFEQNGTVGNSFYTDLAQYSQESFDLISDFTATSGTSVSNVGDKAVFESGEPFGGLPKEFVITAVKGTNVYKFVISQPEDAVTYDDASALAALTQIAQAAKLK